MESSPIDEEFDPLTNVTSPTFSPPPTPSSPSDSSPPPPSSSPPPSSPPPSSSDPPPSSPPPAPSSSPPPSESSSPPPASPPPVPTPPASSPPSTPSPPPALSPPPPIQNPQPPPAPQSPGNSSPPQSPEPQKGSSSSSPPSSNSTWDGHVISPPSPASKSSVNQSPSPASGPPTSSTTNSPSSGSPSNSSTSTSVIQRSRPPPSSNGAPPSLTPPSSLISNAHASNRSSRNHSAETPKSAGGNGNGTAGSVSSGIVIILLLVGIMGVAGWCIRKQKKKYSVHYNGHVKPISMNSSPKSDSALLKVGESTPNEINGNSSRFLNSPADPGGFNSARTWFTYQELVEATNDFSAENELGKGGFGSVYKGYLADGRYVAVKQLNIGGSQGEREFRAEVEIISRIHHRHLVSLVGYCISENKRLLVYDYVSNNTLYFHLHGRPVMNWATRVKIAVGAARGIAYLHEDCYPRIIHRDIKSSNILLDDNFDAHVSDFGLAKLAQDAESHVTTRVVGTFGYMAPEYAATGKLTERSDVYSFGVVLLELITGRKPVDTSQPSGQENLVEWARPLISRALQKEEFDLLADPLLEKNYVGSEMFRMIEVAASCVRHSSLKRPAMGQIMRAFDGMAVHNLSNGMKVGESIIHSAALQSIEISWFRKMAFSNQDFHSDFFSQSSQNSRESNEHP